MKGCVSEAMEDKGMKRGLKNRHLQLISLGGVIGSGYFLGTGYILQQAGPASVLSYLLGGAIVLCVMLCLAELAVAEPIRSPVKDPGPSATAMVSMSLSVSPDEAMTRSIMGIRVSEWVSLLHTLYSALITPSDSMAAEATSPDESIASMFTVFVRPRHQVLRSVQYS